MYIEKFTSSNEQTINLVSKYTNNKAIDFINDNFNHCYLLNSDDGYEIGFISLDINDDVVAIKHAFIIEPNNNITNYKILLESAIKFVNLQKESKTLVFLSNGDIDENLKSALTQLLFVNRNNKYIFEKSNKRNKDLDKRLIQQVAFIKEIDKEKEIVRQTYLADSSRKENDAEHAWHMSVMALILDEHANFKIDKFKVISMLLVHDLVEVYAGDSFAYDDAAQQSAHEREQKAADKLFSMLPQDQGDYIRDLWNEFEDYKTNESLFAHTLDNFQPMMLNAASDGRAWQEHKVALSKIYKRNKKSALGSQSLWEFAKNNFVKPNLEKNRIIKDIDF